MMQQLATQGSNIAVLPVEADDKAKAPDNHTDSGFADAFDSVTQDDGYKQVKQKENHGRALEERNTDQGVPTVEKEARGRNDDNVVIEKGDDPASSQDNNEALAAKGDVTLPSDDDVQPDNETTDYVTFVDAIRQLHGDEQYTSKGNVTENITDGDRPFVDGDIPTIPENGDLLHDPHSEDFAALIDSLKALAKDGKGGASQDKATDELSGDISALAESLNEAIAEWLNSEQGNEEPQAVSGDREQEIQILAASLMGALAKANGEDKRKVDASEGEADGSLLTLADDGALLIDLIKAQLGDGGGKEGKDTEQQAASQQDSQSEGDGVLGESGALMQLLGQGDPNTQSRVSDALADNIIGALHGALSDKQTTAFKQNVSDIVADYQKQLAGGEIPTETLEAQIADALSQITAEPNNDVSALVANEVRHLNLVASAALQTLQSSMAGPSPIHGAQSTDPGVVDLQQLKAERAQHQEAGNNDKSVNIQQPDGQQQLAEKVRWMVNARNSMAEIRLDPPELGSMQVRVNVSGDSASVSFVVQSPQAKDMLMNAEPRLRDMLAEQGISLGESFVSQQQQQGSNSDGEGGQSGEGSSHLAGEMGEETTIIEQPLTRQAQGGIDDYA
ncbi:flagellar hook-length control protein FliK [Alteromonas sp. 14N.309.X.WAT.G.H12]|uniref:flagellar hook-length control protein FliK n=1 Tax=Alteromonas sp. 14N.309.X.WAT.G.H12 TaxID=3120824 RepID=UPI002FD5B4EC